MRYIFLVAIICISMFVKGQSIVLKGSVQDSAKLSVTAALLTLYKAGEERSIANTQVDSLGNFMFTIQSLGSYYIVASAIGYSTSSSPKVIVDGTSNLISLQSIVINSNVTQLAEVAVVSPKNLLSLSSNKIIYNVENDPSLIGLSASDAFARVPFVAVDGLGNVQLKGQSNYRILLNGKPTSIFAGNTGDALKAFPVSNISKIEVITNPSAKFEGEGLTGLINIVTKKKFAGFNGSTSFTAGSLQEGSINPNNQISYKTGKFGISSFIYYAKNLGYKTNGLNEYLVTNGSAPFTKRTSIDTLANEGDQYGANLSVAYDIDTLTSVVLYGNLFGRDGKRDQVNTISQFNQNGNPVQNSIFNSKDEDNNPGFESGIDYLKSFKKLGKEMTISFNYQQQTAETELSSVQFNSQTSSRYLQNRSIAKNQQITFQTDFVFPVSKVSVFELGTSLISRDVKSDFTSASKVNKSDPLIIQVANTDILRYNQNVAGGYGVYSFSKNKFSFKLGTRLELTNVKGNFISSISKIKQNYFSFLPSASFVYQTDESKRLALSYNRRLARPGLLYLNPVVDNRDPFYISFGNEKLAPEFANNFEFSFSSFSNKISYSIGLNGSFVNDAIQRYIVFDPSIGVSQRTYGNVGASSVYGLNGFLSLRPLKGLSYSLNINQNYAIIKNNGNETEQNKGFYISLNQTINYDINSKVYISNNFSYTQAPIQLQGQIGDVFTYSLGAGYKFLKNKLVFGGAVYNLFNKELVIKSRFETANLKQFNTLYRPMRQVLVTLRYNYGKLKQNVTRKKGVKIDDTKQEP